jgi:hypothetical protein
VTENMIYFTGLVLFFTSQCVRCFSEALNVPWVRKTIYAKSWKKVTRKRHCSDCEFVISSLYLLLLPV